MWYPPFFKPGITPTLRRATYCLFGFMPGIGRRDLCASCYPVRVHNAKLSRMMSDYQVVPRVRAIPYLLTNIPYCWGAAACHALCDSCQTTLLHKVYRYVQEGPDPSAKTHVAPGCLREYLTSPPSSNPNVVGLGSHSPPCSSAISAASNLAPSASGLNESMKYREYISLEKDDRRWGRRTLC